MTTLPVTVMVGTRNAAADLEGCLASVAGWAAELLVVDMESTDETLAIAAAFGARVLPLEASGIVETGRQTGIDAATQPWVFVLDADERAPADVERAIGATVRRTDLAGVWVPTKNVIFGEWSRHCYWPNYHLRLFRREAVQWPPFVHAAPQVQGTTEHLPAEEDLAIVHLSHPSISAWMAKANRYTDHEVERRLAQGREPSAPRLAALSAYRFGQLYVGRRGFRDGWHGLAISLLEAVYAVVFELKLWERRRGERPAAPRRG